MAVSDNDDNFHPLFERKRQCAELASVNYCIPGIMSRCSAGLIWQDQKKCKYANKSTVGDRCMHYIASINGHCDNVEAQRELNNLDQPRKTKNSWLR